MKYTLAELEVRDTLCVGQADDLKVEGEGQRVWLSRCGVADGMEYDNQVSIEEYINNQWTITDTYQAA